MERRRRASVASASDDSLFHVGQRLDALAADDDHAVFSHFTRVSTPAHSVVHGRSRARTTTRRRRRAPWILRLVGLSGFYARASLLVGTAFAVAAFGVVATTSAMTSTPPALSLPIAKHDTQIAHELASLSAGAALGAVLGGSLADHYGRRVLLLAAVATGTTATVLAGAVAWCHAALLVSRALAGLALGAQLVLFPIALGELAAQRRRGRVIVSALAGIPLGALLAIHTAASLAKAIGWRVFTGALLGGAEALVLVVLAFSLRDSPRFLAAIGRVESALTLVEAVERAHGIDRNARVPMPSSLFEPPAHELPSDISTPIPTLPPPPPSNQRRRRTSAALTPRMVSLGVSLRKRWNRILFCAPYARRSFGLTVLWVLVAGGLSATIGAASRFTKDVGSPLLSTYVSAAGALGLLASAMVVDRCGRVSLFLFSLLVSALATTLVGMQLFMALKATVLLSIACALLAFASVVTLGAAVLWTLESYGVLIRATGMGLAFVGMGVGAGCGQWLAWSQWLSATSVPYVLWGVAAVFLVVALGTWLWGTETRGLEDVDAVIMTDDTHEHSASSGLASSQLRERDSNKPFPVARRSQQQRRVTYSKDTTQDDSADDSDNNTIVAARRRVPSHNRGPGTVGTGASANSDASTYMGSAGSSARFLSARLSSQRTLSNGPTRGSRGSSISYQRSRSRHGEHNGVPMLDAQLCRGDQTPPFVIRRSSLTRGSPPNPSMPRTRRRSRQSNSGHRESPMEFPPRRQRQESLPPRSSFSTARFSLTDLTTPLPARLDPHSVREHLGRRSSQADRSTTHSSSSSSSSSSCDERMGIAPEHDVMTIDIDPFDDDDHTMPMPMLG